MKTLNHIFRSSKADGADASQVQPSHWNEGHAFTGGVSGQTLVRDTTDASYGAKWAPFGIWTTIPFDAAAWHGAGGMTVVASSGDMAYTVVGQTCFMFYSGFVTLSGAAATSFYVDLPATVPTPRVQTVVGINRVQLGSAWQPGIAYVQDGTLRINFALLNQSAFTLGAAAVQGEMFFQAF